MNKFFIAIFFSLTAFLFSNFAEANHCAGGHKEIKETKDTKDTDSEDSKEAKSN